MAFFTDANGERITVVTNENLQDFLKYAETTNREKVDRDIKLSNDVKLDDFFAGFESKNSEIKSYLALLAEESFLKIVSDERAQECRDLAITHPEAFEKMYRIAGHRTTGKTRNGSVFDVVYEHAHTQNLSDNLYFIDALIDERDFNYYGFVGKREDIRILPKDKAEILAKLFANAKASNEKSSRSKTSREVYSARLIHDILERGDLLNYEPKNVSVASITAKEIREEIEKWINKDNIVALDKKFIFNGNHANKDLLKLLFESQINKSEFVQTSGEQKVHNADEMRKYIENRDLILDAAESVVGKYIPNSRGEERTNTQKIKALMEEFYGKSFEKISLGKVDQDYLLIATYRDIECGNAAKIDDDSLRLVVEHDKDGYWLKKINEKSPETARKIISEMNGSFSARQSRIADMIAPEIAMNYGNENQRNGDIYDTKLSKYKYDEYQKGVANSTKMSIAEKEEFLDKAAEYVSGNLLKKAEQAKGKATEYRRERDDLEEMSLKRRIKSGMATYFKNLQKFYTNITLKFDNGTPNAAEAHLTKENVEKMLADFPNARGIALPDQGKLPLFFGRKKEEERREMLEERIKRFNQELSEFQEKAKSSDWEKFSDVSEYKGRLLEQSTIESLDAQSAAIEAKVHEKEQSSSSYNLDDAVIAENLYDSIIKNQHNIEVEKQRVLERKQKLAEAAAGVLAPEKSSLQAVTSDMDKDTKATVRKANKQITDTLAKPVSERIKTVRE